MASKLHAWDAVWNAVEEAGVQRPYGDPHGPYLPVGGNGVSFGQTVVDRVEELRNTRLATQQIPVIAELVRAVVKSCRE